MLSYVFIRESYHAVVDVVAWILPHLIVDGTVVGCYHFCYIFAEMDCNHDKYATEKRRLAIAYRNSFCPPLLDLFAMKLLASGRSDWQLEKG